MLRQQLCLLTIVIALISVINTQPDPSICPNGVISPPVLDPQWRPIPSRFEVMTELVLSDGVLELSQAFSAQRDSIATSSIAGPVQVYWDYNTNETFGIKYAVANNNQIPLCARQVLTDDSKTSLIDSNSLIVKPSALLGFGRRNQVNAEWGIGFASNGMLRGIPTLQFKSCFYLEDIRATVAATYHVSDPAQFEAYLSRNQSIVLQIDVTIKNQTARDAYKYNIFRYTPNPSRREERQALETPAGVFCAYRISTLPIPENIPERVSANSEALIPNANLSILSTHNLYDTEFQFTRFDVWYPDPLGGSAWQHYTEIHDYATGLRYQYNHTTRQCKAGDIQLGFNEAVPVDGQPNLVQMGDPQHLFLMDDIIYQYTGEKRCRDRVWCHVWIGEKPLPNNTMQHREWHWAESVNGEALRQWLPTKLVLRNYNNGTPSYTYELNIFNYRRSPNTIFEIDYTLSDCYRALGPTVFTLFVRPIRISNLVVDKDDTSILVTFTLLDAPPRTGPVQDPLVETSLDRLINRLQSIINSNGLAFRAKNGSKTVNLRARPDSLNVGSRSTETRSKSTGPVVTALWIVLIIVGIVVGTIGGFLVFKRFAK